MRHHNEAKAQALSCDIASLKNKSHDALRSAWRRAYRSDPPKFLSRDLLELGIAWRLQERAFGGLSAAVNRQLAELAQSIEAKTDITKPRRVRLRPGARLMREWCGETHEVLVTEEGFLWRGKNWRSLSVIAREVTGTRWSGPRFFGLDTPGTSSVNALDGRSNE